MRQEVDDIENVSTFEVSPVQKKIQILINAIEALDADDKKLGELGEGTESIAWARAINSEMSARHQRSLDSLV